MHKKLLCGKTMGILAALLLLFMAVGVAEEERIDATGQWKYVLEDDSATIRGYVEEPRGELEIPSELGGYPVTGIGDRAFELYDGLTSVTIPDSVTSIGAEAFAGCGSLTGVTVPDSVTSIGENPFHGSPLSYINVSSNNPTYAAMDGVLFDTQQKMLVSYPDARQGAYAIPEGVLLIGDSAFRGCEGLTGVTIPASVTSIGVDAFSFCECLTDVTIQAGAISIGDGAFYECSGLTSVTITGGATDFGTYAFEGCEKLILTVQKGSYAEEYAEDYSVPYKYIVAEEKLDAAGQWYFVVEGGGATITNYVEEPEGDLFIPDELDGYPVTGIGEHAFWYSNANCVIIPASVTHIAGDPFDRSNTRTLTLCAVEGSYAEQYARENEYAHEYEIYYILIGASWQLDATGHWYFVVEDGGATITHYVWGSEVDLVIPSELDGHPVTGIGKSVFWHWYNNVHSVIIPASVTYIADNAFYISDDAFDESDVLRFYVAKDSYAEQYAQENYIHYDRIDVGRKWKYTPISNWEEDCDYEEGVAIIGYVAEPAGDLELPRELDGYPVKGVGVWDATIMDEKVGFKGCANLVNVTIPDGVTYIIETAFAQCGSLTSVAMPASVEYIGDEAFYGCVALTSAAIPAGVTYIGDEAFEGCGELVLSVTKGSEGERYAQENEIPYVFIKE